MPVTGALQDINPKVMVMTVLLAVMGILWGRVLLGEKKGPAAANAQDLTDLERSKLNAGTEETLSLKAVALPQLPGRNNVLTHDLFSPNKWTAFSFNGSQGGGRSGVSINGSDNTVAMTHQLRLEEVAKRLTLEAVIQDADGKPSQAFVDDKILSVGSKLTVQEGPDQYELTLEKISNKEVLFTWNKISVILKMTEAFEL